MRSGGSAVEDQRRQLSTTTSSSSSSPLIKFGIQNQFYLQSKEGEDDDGEVKKNLDFHYGFCNNNQNVEVYDANTSQAQKWYATKVGTTVDDEDIIKLHPVKCGGTKTLDVYYNRCGSTSKRSNPNIQIYNDNNSGAQEFIYCKSY